MARFSLWAGFSFDLEQSSGGSAEALGWEIEAGRFVFHRLEELIGPCPHLYPILYAEQSLPEVFQLLKLAERGFFRQKSFQHLLLEWPEHLYQQEKGPFWARQSFPQGLVFRSASESPCIIEPWDAKRLLCVENTQARIHGMGGYPSLVLNRFDEGAVVFSEKGFVSGGWILWCQSQMHQQFPYYERHVAHDPSKKDAYVEVAKNFIRSFARYKSESTLAFINFQTLFYILDILQNPQEEVLLKSLIAEGQGKNIFSYKKAASVSDRGQAFALTPQSLLEYAQIPGFFSRDLYEQYRVSVLPDNWLTFAQSSLVKAFQKSAKSYENWTKQSLTEAQQENFFGFANRLAQETGAVIPRAFYLLMAAQSTVDGNFSYEFLQQCKEFPENFSYKIRLEEIELPLRDVFQNTHHLSIERFDTFKTHAHSKKINLKKFNQKNNKVPRFSVAEETYANNKNWVYNEERHVCSFPDEDVFMESYALGLRAQTKQKILAEHQRVKTLETDLGDGLDVRETLRQWHTEEFMVRENFKTPKSDIGSVVFIFDESLNDAKYSWQSFWFAEPHDQSHLMFYATPFQNNIIGPGIAQSTFGGFAALPLATYVDDPWGHPYIQAHAQSASECLLLVAALAAPNACVLLVGPTPPSYRVLSLLKRQQKHVVYKKLSELHPQDLRKVRTFHILAEAGVRDYAHKYIRKDFN